MFNNIHISINLQETYVKYFNVPVAVNLTDISVFVSLLKFQTQMQHTCYIYLRTEIGNVSNRQRPDQSKK